MGTTVDGLISGMNTTDMISQLMQVESSTQTSLKSKVTVQNKAVSAYQSVNTKMAGLLTAARALDSSNAWAGMKATTSSDAVAVSAKAGALSGSMTFRVDTLAAAHVLTFGGRVSSLTDATTAPVMTGSSFDIPLADGGTATVTPADASLQSVVDEINNTANAAFRAAAVQAAPGQYTLQLTAVNTGADSAFTAPAGIDGLGAATVTTQAADAKLLVGTTNPFAITSSTNTFTDALPGVTLTATRAQAATEAAVTVNVTADKDAVAGNVQALVDAANAALTEIANQTKTGTKGTAGPLAGDPTLTGLSQNILDAVASGAGGLGSLSTVGVQLDRYGKLTFDKQKFLDAYASDPAGTRAYFDGYTDVADPKASSNFEAGWDSANGIGRKLEAIAARATEGVVAPSAPVTVAKLGTLTSLINGRNTAISGLNDQISQWDIRLTARKEALQKQFSAMETALGKMKDQSNWLAGQIAGLPTSS